MERENTIFIGSDILTKSPDRMWNAMREARITWAKNMPDPYVQAFIERITELTGQEDAAILPTCGAANLTALMTHVKRGGQIVTDRHEHILWYEGNGINGVAGVRPEVVSTENGIMTPDQVADMIDYSVCNQIPYHAAVFMENTHTIGGGIPYSADDTKEIAKIAHERNLKVHIDGARIFNAAVAEETTVRELTESVDSISISLNKLVGAPYGAVLCGSKDFIQSAKVNMKMIGAFSLHKAGLVAAAAMTQISEEYYPAFLEDIRNIHIRTKKFAKMLNEIPDIYVDLSKVKSNLFFMDISQVGMDSFEFLKKMEERGVIGNYRSDSLIRFVLSTDITDSDITKAVEIVEQISKSSK